MARAAEFAPMAGEQTPQFTEGFPDSASQTTFFFSQLPIDFLVPLYAHCRVMRNARSKHATPLALTTPTPIMDMIPVRLPVGPYMRRGDSRRSTILHELWREGPISRGSLAERMNLNLPMVSACVQDLIRDGELIEEGYASSTGGRKAQLLDVNPKRGGVVAIEFNGSLIASASSDIKGRLFNHIMRPVTYDGRSGDIIAALIDAIRYQADFLHEDEGIDLTRIGVVMSGHVDEENGISISIPCCPGWENVPVAQMLSEEFGVPVSLGKDTVATTLAEKVSGHYRDLSDFLVLQLGPGLGMGIVLCGMVHRGHQTSVGELGTVLAPGPDGACVPLMDQSSGEALVRRAKQILAGGTKSSIPHHVNDSGEITPEGIFRAADMGDDVARGLIAAAAEQIGIALASTVNLLAPQAVLFGGSLVEDGELFLKMLQESARKYMLPQLADAVRFEPASFGQQSGVTGAVAMALNAHYNSFVD